MKFLKILGLYLSLLNYRYSEVYDKILGNLIENKDDVLVLYKDSYEIVLYYDEKIYEIWIANKWYSYLSKIYISDVILDGDLLFNERDTFLENLRPSRKVLYEFSEIFDNLLPCSISSSKRRKEVYERLSKDFKDFWEVNFDFHFIHNYNIRKKKNV